MGQKDADLATIRRISAVPAILQVISEISGLRFAAVARVTHDSWTVCAVLDHLDFGLTVGGELDVATTLCNEIRAAHKAVVIDKASDDPLYRDHHTPRLYRFESYISVPVFRTDGRFFGTICALDPNPHPLKSSAIQSTMESFARILALQMEAEESLQQTEVDLQEARHTADLREQFIAVLGHDLRNPLFAITVGAERVLRKYPENVANPALQQILTSGRRASQLVDDVLDFARGRLGSGITLTPQPCPDLAAALLHVISEIQNVHPERTIHAEIASLHGIHCDRERVTQLLSNLVANAIAHGSADAPVTISAQANRDRFELSVKNHGHINDDILPRLFQPYARPPSDTPQSGLGLGLYIANEIAKAHGGQLSVTTCKQQGTTFTFTLPS